MAATDVVVFGYRPGSQLGLLLQYKEFISSNNEQFSSWSLPGHFIYGSNDPSNEYGEGAETLDDTIARTLRMEVAGRNGKKIKIWEYDKNQSFIEYLTPQTQVDRDPRGKRVITLPAMVFCKMEALSPLEEEYVRWVHLSRIDEDNRIEEDNKSEWVSGKKDENYKLPFDHYTIYQEAIQRLRQIVRVQPVGKEILGDQFSLLDMQKLYEAILDGSLDKPSFRKWALDKKRGLLEPLNVRDKDVSSRPAVSNRPALLYRFNEQTYNDLQVTKELNFDLKIRRK